MRPLPGISILFLLLTCLVSLPAQTPPRADVEPADGRIDVAPGAAEIRIRFDQDMDGGMSVTRSELPFPKVVGRPRWLDARTLLLEVELEPDTRYGFGINGRGLSGFRSKTGVVAASRELSFRTTGGRPMDEADRRKAVARLREALARDYSYRELHRLAETFSLDEKSLLAAPTAGAFAEILARDLARIPDPHLSISFGGRNRPCFRRVYDANVSVNVVARKLGNWNKLTNDCATAEIEGGMLYVLLTTLADEAAVAAAIGAVAAAEEARAFVIDLRLNGGGDENRARRLAGLFSSERLLYAKHRSIDRDAEDGFGPTRERWLEPVPGLDRRDRPVAVLCGPACLSSTEALLLMFRAIPGAVLIGATSGGSSGNPQPIELGSGLTVNLPSWIAMDAAGQPFEGRGIDPDITVAVTAEDLRAGRDPVLDRALDELRRRLDEQAE